MKRAVPISVLAEPIFHIDNGPDTPFKQALESAVEIFRDMDLRVTEMVHGGPVLVLAREEADLDAVDKTVPTLLLHHRLRLVGLIVAEVVRRQRFLNSVHADSDLLIVVRSAVFSEQILKYIRWDVLAALDVVQEVLSNHLAGENTRCLLI